ncbi:hypothetical protein [Streptomyces klenkii]
MAFTQLLADAGLETAEAEGAGHVENLLRPLAAWRPVIAAGATPTTAVRLDRPDLVAELNAQWYRLATEHGIIGADGTFLINVAGSRQGTTSHGWTRVRLTARWDLAGVLGDRPGQPEFVTLSADGDVLLGVTTEEYEVWLVAVDGFARQREEEAQAAARETPQEREATWAAFFRGPGPMKALGERWAAGLAHNPAAPEDVLKGLPGRPERPRGHPDSPDKQMRRLALDDPASTVDLVERFSRDADEEVRLRAAQDPRLTTASAVRLLDDPQAAIRRAAALYPRLPARVLSRLLRSEAAEAAAANPSLPVDVMRQMLRHLTLKDPAVKLRCPSPGVGLRS